MKSRARMYPLVVFACVSLAIASLAAQQWSERGPVIGGRLSAIVAADGGSTLIVASPGGGVWRSADGGRLWTFPPNRGAADLNFVHLEWDAAAPARLFGLTYNALYASTDRAETWIPLVNETGAPAPLGPLQTAVPDPAPFAQLRLAPSARVVVAALPCSGLFYSFDGVHFTQHWPFRGESGNPDNCIGTIAADPVSRRVYFSTLGQGPVAKVFRSDCGPSAWQPNAPCLKWQPAGSGLPANLIVSAMTSVSEPGAGDHLVLQIRGHGNALETYATTDGVSWSLQSSQPRSWGARALIHPAPGPSLFEGFVGLGYSPDLGVTWQPMTFRMAHPDFRSIYADVSAGKLWAVTDGANSGNYANVLRWNWKPGQAPSEPADLGHAGLSVWQAYYATVVPRGDARRVFAGSQDNASLCADDVQGRSWAQRGGAPTGGDAYVFQVAPSSPNRAYGWANEPFRFVRTDNAASAPSCAAVNWTVVTPDHDPPNAQLISALHWSRHAMAVHPRDPDRLYFALNFGIGISTNAGDAKPIVVHHEMQAAAPAVVTTQGRTRPGRIERLRPTSIHVDANGVIYVGTDGRGLFRSADDGVTWTPWGLNTEAPAVVTAIASSPDRAPTFWAATTEGLYRLPPGSADWTRVTGEGRTVSDVAIDRSCPSRVYAAYGFAGVRGQQRGGVSVTADNGATWTSITSGEIVDRVPVTAIDVDPQQPKTIYAATYGRGFWVFDWGTKLPRCGR